MLGVWTCCLAIVPRVIAQKILGLWMLSMLFIMVYQRLVNPKARRHQTASLNPTDKRVEVRRQSFNECKIHQRRWDAAIRSDKCWTDRYPGPRKQIVMTHV